MKTKLMGAVFGWALLASCDHSEPQPIQTSVVLPLRLEQLDFVRHFEFDGNNRLSKVRNSHRMPNNVILESTTEFLYSTDGRLEKTITGDGNRLEFEWEDGKVVRTDEYINDQFSQYHTFSYDEKGRLKEWTMWQDIPEFGGVVPKAKEIYLYDRRDNLTNQFLYFYSHAIRGHELLTAFEYSDYDDHIEAESIFDGYAFNPAAVFRKNNPGKMVTRNRLGNSTQIDQYSYAYDIRGYAIRKTTTSLFSYSGSGGSYDTYYHYAQR